VKKPGLLVCFEKLIGMQKNNPLKISRGLNIVYQYFTRMEYFLSNIEFRKDMKRELFNLGEAYHSTVKKNGTMI
jgi:hypothetical protein